ncbi:MAG: response regulator [Syntrophomonadaceae bacterium]|nr:response regulator [Syntrophomonadaceae bacterium]
MKILIVEDNKVNRILLKDLLHYHGYNTLEAKDGAEGIALAKEHLPDLILLDIQMPVMDGVTALKILKESDETKNIKVIAFTSFAMKGDQEKLFAAGADYYISKPVNTRELPKLVRQILHGQ